MASIKCTYINCIVIALAEKTGNTSTGTTFNTKNLFKMPNTHFKSQIYRYKVVSYCTTVSSVAGCLL